MLLLDVYQQRAMLVLALACIPIAVLWTNTTQILLFFAQDADIAAEASACARWLIPSLVPYVPLACHVRFLQTQSIIVPVMASSAVTALTHVLVCWALVYGAGMGSKGAALSGAIACTTNVAVLVLYSGYEGTAQVAEKPSAAMPSKGLAVALRGVIRAPSVGLHARKVF
jgi:MATE family multidrug resistance protein